MTNLITNAAAAAFMFPIALAVATTLHVNFMPFVIILMLGTSYSWALAPGLECRPWPSPYIYRLGFLLASPREGSVDDAASFA